jgi:hypothetical protein
MRAGRHAIRANDREFPSDAPCPGIGEAGEPARDRIVSLGMMGGGAFARLKAGRTGPKTTKQAEIRPAFCGKFYALAPGLQKSCHSCGKDVRF